MPMLEAKVTRVTQTNLIDRLGNPAPAIQVQFVVGDHGPFTLTMPAGEFSAQTVKAKLQTVADHINALPGIAGQ